MPWIWIGFYNWLALAEAMPCYIDVYEHVVFFPDVPEASYPRYFTTETCSYGTVSAASDWEVYCLLLLALKWHGSKFDLDPWCSIAWGQNEIIVYLELPLASLKYPCWSNFISKNWKTFFLLYGYFYFLPIFNKLNFKSEKKNPPSLPFG